MILKNFGKILLLRILFGKKKWDSVLEWDFSKPEIKWFKGAKLNITENCIDRHLKVRGDKTAILFEPNNPDEETQYITYNQLHKKVNKFANVLKQEGVKKGDRVCIYLPMIPELAISILACARIGAIHSRFGNWLENYNGT